jgi:hypothetical protein
MTSVKPIGLSLLMLIPFLSISQNQNGIGPEQQEYSQIELLKAPVTVGQDARIQRGVGNLRYQNSASTVIWSEDFANGIPTSWVNQGFTADQVTGNLTPNIACVWEYRGVSTTPDTGTGTRGGHSPPSDHILSPTHGNGFIIFDSSYLDNGGNTASPGSGACPAPHLGTLTTDTIDLSAHPDVVLSLSSYARTYLGQFKVAISRDGGLNFPDTLQLHSSLGITGFSANGNIVDLDISNAAGGHPLVVLQFIFEGRISNGLATGYYFWMIDDITINPLNTNEFRIVDYNGDQAKGIIYPQGHPVYGNPQVNISSFLPVRFASNIVNFGSADQYNVRLNVDIADVSGNVVVNLQSPARPILARADTGNYNDFTTTNSWTPTVTGEYDAIYYVTSDSANAITPFDTVTFSINDSIHGAHFNSVDNTIGTADNLTAVAQVLTFPGPPSGGSVSLEAISVHIGSGSDTTGNLVVEIYDTAGFSYGFGGFPGAPVFFRNYPLNGSNPGQRAVLDVTSNGNPLPLSLNTGYWFVFNMIPGTPNDNIEIGNDQTIRQANGNIAHLSTSGIWFSGYSNSRKLSNLVMDLVLFDSVNCTVIDSFPYQENFRTASSNKIPPCYSRSSSNPNSNFNWLVNAGSTTSSNTGPSSDFDGTNTGNYLYTEASSPAMPGDLAYLNLPKFDITSLQRPELTFGYHMYGADITTLKVEYFDLLTAQWIVIDSISGQVQTSSSAAWMKRSVDLNPYVSANLQLRFVHERGTSFNGDAAIDNITVRNRPLCEDPTNFSVSFKSESKVALAWNSDANITTSVVQFGPTGFTLGTGTIITTTAQSITSRGLNANTCYDFYVLDSCIEATSWVGPLQVCTDPVCGVNGIPSNVTGDSTGCNGGAITLTATPAPGMLLGWTLNGALVGVGDTLEDIVSKTSLYKARSISADGSSYFVGPFFGGGMTSIYQQDASGLYITVHDTIIIDSVSVRSNGYMKAQVIVTDGLPVSSGGKVLREGEVFTTPASTVATLKVPAGLVLTPGNYFMAVNFIAGNGMLYRATSGAAYPYESTTAGLMTIDSSSFGGSRYFYLYRMQVRHACIDDQGVDALVHTLNAYAGEDDSVTICVNDDAVKLTDFLDYYTVGGFWTDDDLSGALTDSTVDARLLSLGNSYKYSYYIFQSGSCPGQDTATITVTVEDSVFAGFSASDTISDCDLPIDLNSYLSSNATLGGTWIDRDTSGGLVGSVLNPANVVSGKTYRFQYLVSSGCGEATAFFDLYVDCFLDLPNNQMSDFSLFPNPTTGILTIKGNLEQLDLLKIEVYSASGQLLIKNQVDSNSKLRIDMSSLSSGLYLVKIATPKGSGLYKVRKL